MKGKVLITGGSGFVGQHLARELVENGYEIYSFDRGNEVVDKGLYKKSYLGDLLKISSLRTVIREVMPGLVFHLAAQASGGLSFKKPNLTFKVNILGTTNLLETVRQINGYHPTVMVAGSAEVFGKVNESELPVDENTPFYPTNPYAVSKAAVYYLSKIYATAYGLKIVTALPFNHSGPGQREGFFIPDMCVQIARIEQGLQKPVILTGRLDVERDISDVRDIVRGYRMLAEKGRTGEEYVLCSGKKVKMSKLLDKLLALSKVKIKHRYDELRMRPIEFPVIYGSYAKAKRELGWKPEISLERTLQETLEWYRNRVV